jgi:HPt (histidine-containing phosphotransfer) domain-containing protein
MPDPDSPGPLRSDLADSPEMADLIGIFLAELPARVNGLVTAYNAGDADTLKRLTHQIKGSAGGFGFQIVGDAADRVEAALKASANPQDALSSISAEFRELVELCHRATAGSGLPVERPRF